MSDYTSDYFDEGTHDLAESFEGRSITAVALVGTRDSGYPHIDLTLDDGRVVQFGGIWHNDSTAGVYMEEQ